MADYIMVFAIITGLLAGILAGLLGIGGGVVFVPLLTTFYPQLGIHSAIATSTGFVIFAGLSSFISHNRHAKPLPDVLPAIIGGSLLGAVMGPHLALMLPGQLLAILFAAMVLLPYLVRILRIRLKSNFLTLAICGLVIGTMAALFGIGGGALLVPLLTQGFKRDVRRAITTSALFIVFNASIATTVYTLNHAVDWHVLAFAAPAGILGAHLGSRISRLTPPRLLKIMLAVLSILIILKMLQTSGLLHL